MVSSQALQSSSFLRRFQIPLFFTLAFALSWVVWGSMIAQQYGLLSFSLPDTSYFGVSLAALIVAGLVDGWVGIRDLLRRMVRWRVNLLWYVIAIVLPLVIIGLYRLFGGSVSVGRILSLEASIAYFIQSVPFFILTEETAWRGFALPRLQVRYNALTASLILGLLWGVWHTPLFFMPGAVQTQLPFLPFVLMAMGQSVLFAWVYNNTGGSVLLVALLHASTDALLTYIGVGLDARSFWIMTVVTGVAAVIVVLLAGPAHLSRTYRVDQPPIIPPGMLQGGSASDNALP